jgi:probable phosphoglycerate mutase
METAAILAEPQGLRVVSRDGLREISHGRWEQMTRCEVEERFPEEAAEWEKDPFTFAPAGGESGLAVTARALPVLIEIVRAHPGDHVLVVSHKATIRLLLSSILGFDPRRYRDNLDQNPCALNIVDFKDTVRARLTLFNDTSHYAEAGLAIPAVPSARLSKSWADPAPESPTRPC